MSASFVAVDFETANSFKGSACEVGLVRVINGSVDAIFGSLIKPHPEHGDFDAINVSIHGIQASDVNSAPEFDVLWPAVRDFIGDLPLVAHNAVFDTRVLRELLSLYEIPIPTMSYFCTLVLSRRVLDLVSFTLPFVADELGVSETTHHRAESDARRAAEVALALLNRSGHAELTDMAAALGVSAGRFDAQSWLGSRKLRTGTAVSTKATIEEMRQMVNLEQIDVAGPLFDRQIAFTGGLTSMTRNEAWFHVLAAGGEPEANVTARTDYLVVGTEGGYSIDPTTANTSKFVKAELLRSKGSALEIIDELTFLQMI